MLITLAGAMSTAELGLSLAEMIRQGKVHAICCTGANLEEDLFNLVAHDHYVRVPNYRDLAGRRAGAARPPAQPGHRHLHPRGGGDAPHRARAARAVAARRGSGASALPPRVHVPGDPGGLLESTTRSTPKDSWMVAAAEKNLPIFVPGWEDSTLGNIFAARVIDGRVSSPRCARASST
jgi:deoxyhypusine synthase